jgi:multidrug efflux pump subunit AcrA (membrane-fusion protein)
MKLRILAVIALIAIGVGAIGFAVIGPSLGSSAAPQYLTATATRENVVAQSVATGSVAPSAIYGLAFGSQPQLVASTTSSSSSSSGTGGGASTWLVKSVNVAVGDSVTAGQTLAVADSSTVTSTLAIANASLAVAKAKLATDKGGLSATDRAAAAVSIQQAQQQLAQAQKSAPISTASANLQLSQAQAALKNAQDQLAADTAAGPLANTITADKNAVSAAQNNLDSLNLQIAAAQAQSSSTSTQNSLALQQAQQAVTAAQTTPQQASQQLQQAVTAAQARLDQDISAAASPPTPTQAQTIADDRAALTAAQTAVSTAVATAVNNAVAAAQAKLDTLNAQLSGSGTLSSITDQQNVLKLSQAQAALKSAQDQLAADLAAGPPSTLIKSDQAAVTNATNQLASLKLQLSTSANSSAAQLASASLGLTSAQLSYASRTAPATAATLASDQAAITNAQESVRQAKIQVAAATLIAPADGVVASVGVVAGVLAPSGNAVTLEVGPMQVTSSFAESDIGKLKVGQPTTVTVAAAGSTPIDGIVSQITPTASTSAGGSSVVTYAVRITLTNAPASVLSGMTASAAVTTAQAASVIAVPAISLVGSTGNYGVRVIAADGTSQVVPVQVGLVTTSLAEVKSGITEGETVSIGTVSARTSTTTTGGGVAIPGVGGGGGGGGFGRGGGIVAP